MSENHIGDVVGIYTIIEVMNYKDSGGKALYKGQCNECGFKRVARLYDLKRSKKCTHIRIDGEIAFNRVDWADQRLRCIFDGMKRRCYDISCKAYRWYGKKGIKICDEWMDNPLKFQEWALQNGYGNSLTIDRINSDDNYCPENCRWVEKEINSKYTSRTSLINVDGVVHSGSDWAKTIGIGRDAVNRYVRQYGLDNTVLFIRKFLANPISKSELKSGQSYYDLYVN